MPGMLRNHAARYASAACLVALATLSLPAACGLAAEPAPIAPSPAPAPSFAADRPEIAFLGPADALLLVVRPAEFARRPELAPAAKALDALLATRLQAMTLVAGAELPPIRLADVDYIAYVIRPEAMWQTAHPDSSDDADQAIPAMGCDVAIRLVAATDVKAWAAHNVPDMQTIQDVDFTYLQGPGDPGQRLHLAQRDPHTFIMSNSAERLRRLATGSGMADAEGAASFAEQWATVDGGLATLAVAPGVTGGSADFDVGFGAALGQLAAGVLGVGVEPGQPNPVEEAARTIGENLGLVCVGVDLTSPGTLSVRFAGACPNYDAAKKVRESLEFFQEFALAYKNAIEGAIGAQAPDPASQRYVDGLLFACTMFGDATADFRLGEGKAVDVCLEAVGDLPPSLRDALAAAMVIFDVDLQPAAVEAPPRDAPGNLDEGRP